MNELLSRFAAFASVFIAMEVWEVIAPRRAQVLKTVAKREQVTMACAMRPEFERGAVRADGRTAPRWHRSSTLSATMPW